MQLVKCPRSISGECAPRWCLRAVVALSAALALGMGLVACDTGGGAGAAAVADYPIAFVERALPRDDAGLPEPDDLRDPGAFRPGARLLLKRRSAPDAAAVDLTTRLFAPGERYDVRDVTASADGARLLFALRGPFIEGAQDKDQPRWALWEYSLAADTLHRVIASDVVAAEGNDIMPAYLPDGRILFASTRQQSSRAVLVDEGKPQFAALDDTRQHAAYLLHVMDADGSNLRQITFNGSHDLWPTVLPDGRILFARQENGPARVAMHLYTVRPDGRGLSPAFGVHSHAVVDGSDIEFAKPRVLDDGRVLAIERPYRSLFLGGALAALDVAAYSDDTQRLDGAVAPAGSGIAPIALDGWPAETVASPGGRYADATPLGDGTGRLLVSWSACRLQPAATPAGAAPARIVPCSASRIASTAWQEAAPVYGVFVLDPRDGTRLPVKVPREGYWYTDLAVAVPRAATAYLDSVWGDTATGVLHIRSVYDLDGAFDPLNGLFPSLAELADPATTPASERPARWLRLEKRVSIPDRDVRDFRSTAFGVTAGFGMREILGYAPVEPDGSVRVAVPANVAFTISVVDADGRRIGGRHAAWMQLMPGEERTCAGCHDDAVAQPHGRTDAGPVSINDGAAGPWPGVDPSIVPQDGETMAQARTRLAPSALALSADLLFSDAWTDPAQRTPDASSALRYADLATPAPVSMACANAWSERCRAVIHYETHLQPLWSVDRRVFAGDGVTVTADHTCTACHSTRDAANALRVPAAQLDLGDDYAGDVPDHLQSYRDLVAGDDAQALIDGALVDQQVQATDTGGNPLFVTDANGNPVLDGSGNPIPLMVPVPVPPALSLAGARASTRFFPLFAPGGSHAGWLSTAELRLVAEWIDLGGQYYNDPFAAPVN